MDRGGESTSAPAWSLGKEDSHLSIGVQPFLPAGIADGAIYRLELVRDDGRSAWSMEMTAGRMREHLATPAGIVHVTLPTAGLAPGTYELRIVPAAEPQAAPIYRARVEITAAR